MYLKNFIRLLSLQLIGLLFTIGLFGQTHKSIITFKDGIDSHIGGVGKYNYHALPNGQYVVAYFHAKSKNTNYYDHKVTIKRSGLKDLVIPINLDYVSVMAISEDGKDLVIVEHDQPSYNYDKCYMYHLNPLADVEVPKPIRVSNYQYFPHYLEEENLIVFPTQIYDVKQKKMVRFDVEGFADYRRKTGKDAFGLTADGKHFYVKSYETVWKKKVRNYVPKKIKEEYFAVATQKPLKMPKDYTPQLAEAKNNREVVQADYKGDSKIVLPRGKALSLRALGETRPIAANAKGDGFILAADKGSLLLRNRTKNPKGGHRIKISRVVFEETPEGDNAIAYGKCISGNCKSGQGKFKTSDGSIYEGKFVNSKFNGEGKFTQSDGTVIEGTFKGNQLHGIATTYLRDGKQLRRAVYHDGQVYAECVEGDCWSGDGTMLTGQGDRLEGHFIGGFPFGEGRLIRGDTIMAGNFSKGRFHGLMQLSINGQKKEFAEVYARGKYYGDCVSGDCWGGTGTLRSSDGTVYWAEQFREGKPYEGAFKQKDAEKEIDGFMDSNSEMHGTVIATKADGTRIEKLYVHGKLRGTVTLGTGRSQDRAYFKIDSKYILSVTTDEKGLPNGFGFLADKPVFEFNTGEKPTHIVFEGNFRDGMPVEGEIKYVPESKKYAVTHQRVHFKGKVRDYLVPTEGIMTFRAGPKDPFLTYRGPYDDKGEPHGQGTLTKLGQVTAVEATHGKFRVIEDDE